MIVKVCVVFVLACTLLKSAQGIINADLVKIENFSYTVVVSYKLDIPYSLSGSIIHEKFILTLGKPFVNLTSNEDNSSLKPARLLNVREIEVQAHNQKAKVKAVYLPREWLKLNKIHGSVAILELENKLDFSRGNLQILKLPTTDLLYMEEYEKFAVFTGFGHDHQENIETRLRAMEVNIVDCPETGLKHDNSSNFCGSAIVLRRNINNSENQPLEACAGDEGGPLVYRKNTIIGIMDYTGAGDNRLGQNHPATFTNISYHLDFIKNVTDDYVFCNDLRIKLIYTLY